MSWWPFALIERRSMCDLFFAACHSHIASLIAITMNIIGQLVNLKQVHRGTLFCPLSVYWCVCFECMCLSQDVIDWISE